MLSFEVVDSPGHPLVSAVRKLFDQYVEELEVDLCFQNYDDELATLPLKYGPPSGILYVVLDNGAAIACGALRGLDEHTCELKRIYICPSHRGAGLGREITVRLMDAGRHLGYEVVRLDTLRRLTTATRLYTSLDFAQIEPYNDDGGNDIVYFERRL